MARHNLLVRTSHALNIPILLMLGLSGLSIYWASPVYHPDVLATLVHPNWFYDTLSLGRYQLAAALRLHWLFAYLLMANGVLYLAGLVRGSGWRALKPRLSDGPGALRMIRYYAGYWPARILHKPWPHPEETGKYNPLQRLAYATIPVAGLLAVASGWAMHKPATLGWLAALFGGYAYARVWHFWMLWYFVAFSIGHVVMVAGAGWPTSRAMLAGDPQTPWAARRAFLAQGAYLALAVTGLAWILPDARWRRLTGRVRVEDPMRERLLNRVLDFDDDVAEALFSPTRSVPTFDKSQAVSNLRNNYNGQTPGPGYLDGWRLEVKGMARGQEAVVTLADLQSLPFVEQTTRLVCVEGWSAIAWWGGVRLSDFLERYPPPPEARYLRIDSDVNLDGAGHPDPYYVSIDLATARHPQTLLATHHNGQPLTTAHGAPLRLVAPMKLGLKNIKAITRITYTVESPPDYWNERGYSKYDGV